MVAPQQIKKFTCTAEIIMALSGIKSYVSFTKTSRSVLKKIALLHARRRTPAPLLPKPPSPKGGEEAAGVGSEAGGRVADDRRLGCVQEREVLGKQKRDKEVV
jgi:hypothetical protein